MNTYSENLQQTVSNTLMALTDEQEQIVSEQITAQHNLYYTQGAEITANDKLAATEAKADYYQKVNDQGVINHNKAMNILTSATEANTNVVNTVSNMSTAAANVQIASNAIALLASDIGAALNIATASLFGTDSYRKIKDANSFINEVANDAKNASLTSMEASSYASEIISGSILTQATTVKAKIDNLLKATQAEFNNLSALAITENQKVCDARTTERQAEGALKDANQAALAINQAYTNANNQLNYGLSVSVQSSTKISVNFTALKNPLPTFIADPASAIAIPPAAPSYYLALVPEDKQALLSPGQAEQLYAQSTKGNGQFIPVAVPTGSNPTVIDLTANKVDVYCNSLNPGNSYVAFLYIEISGDYKRFIGNFSDILSVASQSFTLASPLPLAQKSTNTDGGQTDASNPPSAPVTKIKFSVKTLCDNNIKVPLKFRCIFVEIDDLSALNLMRSNEIKTAPIYFNLEIAEQVSPANYISVTTPFSTDNKSTCCNGDNFEINVPLDVTDNFGNPIKPGKHYKPYILTTVADETINSSQYVNVLSEDLDPLVLFPVATSTPASESPTITASAPAPEADSH